MVSYRDTVLPSGEFNWPAIRAIAKRKARQEIASGSTPREAMRWSVSQVMQTARALRSSVLSAQKWADMSAGQRLKNQYLQAAEIAEGAIPPRHAEAEANRASADLMAKLIASTAQIEGVA